MTKQEALVITAYTGVLMCDWCSFHEYAEKVMERPVWTHEFADHSFMEELKEKVKPDLMKIISEVIE